MVDLPQESKDRQKTVVDVGEEGKIGLLIFGDRTLDLYTRTTWQDNGDTGKEEWRHEKAIPWPRLPDCNWRFASSTKASCFCEEAGETSGVMLHTALASSYVVSRMMHDEVQYFTVDLKTFWMESLIYSLCVASFDTHPDYLYVGFPPPFSLPTV